MLKTILRFLWALLWGLIGPGNYKKRLLKIYIFLGIQTPSLFSAWICSYLNAKFSKYDTYELQIIFYIIFLTIGFLVWLRVQNAKRMAENRAIKYFNLNTYELENRDAWIKNLPKFIGYFIKLLLRLWDFIGMSLEKLKRPFRWIRVLFKIKK